MKNKLDVHFRYWATVAQFLKSNIQFVFRRNWFRFWSTLDGTKKRFLAFETEQQLLAFESRISSFFIKIYFRFRCKTSWIFDFQNWATVAYFWKSNISLVFRRNWFSISMELRWDFRLSKLSNCRSVALKDCKQSLILFTPMLSVAISFRVQVFLNRNPYSTRFLILNHDYFIILQIFYSWNSWNSKWRT